MSLCSHHTNKQKYDLLADSNDSTNFPMEHHGILELRFLRRSIRVRIGHFDLLGEKVQHTIVATVTKTVETRNVWTNAKKRTCHKMHCFLYLLHRVELSIHLRVKNRKRSLFEKEIGRRGMNLLNSWLLLLPPPLTRGMFVSTLLYELNGCPNSGTLLF